MFASGHEGIATPETFANPNFVRKLKPNEKPADFGFEHQSVIKVNSDRYLIDHREKFEGADHESIFWSETFLAILEPGEEYCIRTGGFASFFCRRI